MGNGVLSYITNGTRVFEDNLAIAIKIVNIRKFPLETVSILQKYWFKHTKTCL